MSWKKVLLLEILNRVSLGQYTILEKEIISLQYCRLVFLASPVAEEALPGQFVMVYPPAAGMQKMLPRPFSIFAADRETGQLTVFFRIIGTGTTLLSLAEPGTELKIMGPLGKGFPVPPAGSLLVAGGIGMVPLVFLAASVEVEINFIYGAANSEQLSCPPDYINRPGLFLHEVTEDGSCGEQGNAVDLFRRLLPRAEAVFACGPKVMLELIARDCLAAGVAAWVSMEERMACGIGACRGCAVMTRNGYQRVCSEGPVFPVEEVFLHG
ncbi:MAG: dihydroorotate dehydrogenase electron transfer subunit [Bacillota bacterium]|nr:dihydroorotate dehydrogenase electron transfer subunit [Bacillota bacterium]